MLKQYYVSSKEYAEALQHGAIAYQYLPVRTERPKSYSAPGFKVTFPGQIESVEYLVCEIKPSKFEHYPLPWSNKCFLIQDANGKELLHVGVMNQTLDPRVKEELADLIVKAVNAYGEDLE